MIKKIVTITTTRFILTSSFPFIQEKHGVRIGVCGVSCGGGFKHRRSRHRDAAEDRGLECPAFRESQDEQACGGFHHGSGKRHGSVCASRSLGLLHEGIIGPIFSCKMEMAFV